MTPNTENFQMALRLHNAGDLAEAERLYQLILAQEPKHADALHLLGVIAHQTGHPGVAIARIRDAIAINPTAPEYFNNLGNVLQESANSQEAVECYRRAIALKPDYLEPRANLANALIALGRLDEAEERCRWVLAHATNFYLTYNSLGHVLRLQGRLAEAEANFRLALALKPDLLIAWKSLGHVLKDLGRLDEAEACFRRAVELAPRNWELHCDIGTTLQSLGRLREAEASFRRSLELKPDFDVAHNNLGNTLRLLGRLTEAEASYRHAIEEKPDWHVAHNNLGTVVMDLGRFAEAEASFRKALHLEPFFATAKSNLLFLMNYHPDLTAAQIFAEYKQFDERFGSPLSSAWRAHPNVRDPVKRLRVGYISPDFRRHSARHFVEPLLVHHDPAVIESFAYAELATEDDVSNRIKLLVEHWIPTISMSDSKLAERIRQDRIDVLVDLAGHTSKNRLLVFARKPSPVSVSMLGFGYTTGLSAIDWYLSDSITVPESADQLFSERVWRLSQCMAYRPAENMGEVSSLPALLGGHVTFCTLTRALRINHRTIKVWSEILRRLPGSRLRVDSISVQNRELRQSLVRQFYDHGVAEERLELTFHSPPWDVLREVDIMLDSFPHNSGTTLYEGLYMGIPVITMADRPSVGRLGASIVTNLGHPEWVALNEADYIERAVALAADLPRLSELRARLRSEMRASPLMDERGFARKVEFAYREMWRRWCSG